MTKAILETTDKNQSMFLKMQQIDVEIEGLKPYISNQFVSIEDKDISASKKIKIQDGKIIIDSDRIMAFLIANNPKTPAGCIKLFTDSKKYKAIIPKAEAYIGIDPRIIPISSNDKYVIREDKVGGGGVPQMVKRPMVEKWGAKFKINLIENPDITFDRLRGWFERGGIEVGLGAWRPRYGQFIVKKFETIK